MPKKSTSKVKEESVAKDSNSPSVEGLCLYNPIPIYTLSITRGSFFWVQAKVASCVRRQEPPAEAIIRSAGVKRAHAPQIHQELPADELSTHTQKKQTLRFIANDRDLEIYGDLATSERAHQTVLKSIGEALEAGVFEQRV